MGVAAPSFRRHNYKEINNLYAWLRYNRHKLLISFKMQLPIIMANYTRKKGTATTTGLRTCSTGRKCAIMCNELRRRRRWRWRRTILNSFHRRTLNERKPRHGERAAGKKAVVCVCVCVCLCLCVCACDVCCIFNETFAFCPGRFANISNDAGST